MRGRPPLLVGVLKGAFVFMSDLARAIDLPVEFDFMAVASYGSSTRTSGVVRIVKDLDSDLTGRHVLVVEDIVDSGLTLAFSCATSPPASPASLAVCALLVKELEPSVDELATWAFASRGISWSATGSTWPSVTATCNCVRRYDGPMCAGLRGKRHVPVDLKRIEAAVVEILAAVGEQPDRDGLRATPGRVARVRRDFLRAPRGPGRVPDGTFEADHDELVLVRDIALYSVCEHHLLPWFGRAHVAYIPGPDGRVTGLSKMVRLVDGYAKRPQVQERLTSQVADTLVRVLDPRARWSSWRPSTFACRCGASRGRGPRR